MPHSAHSFSLVCWTLTKLPTGTAVKLRQVGISPVRPLQGDSRHQLGFPVESAFDPIVQQLAAPQFEPTERAALSAD